MLWGHVQSAFHTAFTSICGVSSSRRAQLRRPLNPLLQHSSGGSVSSSTSRWPSDQPMLAPDHCSSSQLAPVLSRISSYEPGQSELLHSAPADNSKVAGCSPVGPSTPNLQQQAQQQKQVEHRPGQQQKQQQQEEEVPPAPQAASEPAAATAACAAAGACTFEKIWKQLQKQKQKPSGVGTASSGRMRHRSGLYASGIVGSRRLSLKAPAVRAAQRYVM
jgi:hypothetical protein